MCPFSTADSPPRPTQIPKDQHTELSVIYAEIVPSQHRTTNNRPLNKEPQEVVYTQCVVVRKEDGGGPSVMKSTTSDDNIGVNSGDVEVNVESSKRVSQILEEL